MNNHSVQNKQEEPLLSVGLRRLLTFFHLPDSVLRLLHRLQSFALLRFVFSFQSFPSFFPTLRHSKHLQPPYHCSSPCKLSCLQASSIPPRSFIFCNPLMPQPWYHCSSPCKLSWSEDRRSFRVTVNSPSVTARGRNAEHTPRNICLFAGN